MARSARHAARSNHAHFVVRPLFAALVASGVVAPAHGATIPVTSGGDAGTGTTCTARQAVVALNNASTLGTSCIPTGPYATNDTVDLNLQTGTIALSGPLTPLVPMTFDGPGATTLTISGQGLSRVIENPMGQAQVEGLTIANGLSSGPGGCIFLADLLLTDSVVSGCRASPSVMSPYQDGIGGGIAVKYLNSYRSTIVGNTADTAGGGVFAYGGQFTQTLVTGNTVSRSVCTDPDDPGCVFTAMGGGGILGGTVLTLGSTISGNVVNASQLAKYDETAQQNYNVNIGLGGGISQFPLEFIAEEYLGPLSKSSVASVARKASTMFGAGARNLAGPAKAAVKAKRTALKAAGKPRMKADGIVDSGLGVAFSTISGNRVTGSNSPDAKYAGGGAIALSLFYNVEIASSTISGNRLEVPSNTYAPGSALLTTVLDLTNTTITGNVGSTAVAMQFITMDPGAASAKSKRGGFARAWTKWNGKLGSPQAKAGVARNKDLTQPTFDSTIISNNGAVYDLDCIGSCIIAGSNNLIRTWNDDTTVPPDTLTSDPHLAPLGRHGGVASGAPGHPLTGPMPVHLLFIGSPAIDAGSNPEGFETDQRGLGFPRVVGSGPDIGAIEGVTSPDFPVPALAPWLVAMLSALLGVLGLRSRRRST
jgi:hypothetical protein